MVNRVLLDTTELKVSKPGFDVLTAVNDQLIFQSDKTASPVLLTGYVSLLTGQNTIVYYGKTFTNKPPVWFKFRIPEQHNWWICCHDNIFQYENGGPAVKAISMNDQIYFNFASGYAGYTFEVYYQVWDYDL